MTIEAEAEYSQKTEDKSKNQSAEDIAKLKLSRGGRIDASLTFNLQAIWTAYLDYTEEQLITKNAKSPLENYKWGQILKDVFECAELQFYIGAKITSGLSGDVEFSYDWLKPADKSFECSPDCDGNLSFTAPVGAQLSVFSWNYNLAKVDAFKLSKKQLDLFPYIRLLENVINNNPVIIRWGEVRISETCYLEKTNGLYGIGEAIVIYLPFSSINDPKFTGGKGFRDAITANDEKSDVDILSFKDANIKYRKVNRKIGLSDYTDDAYIIGRVLIHSENPQAGDLVLSKDGSTSKQILDYFEENSQVTLDYIHIDEDGGGAKLLTPEQNAVLSLPEVSRHSVKKEASPQNPTIQFEMQFYNFSDEYIWVRLAEKEKTWNRSFEYKRGPSEPYREWNLVRLAKSGSVYNYEIKLNQIKGIKDEWLWDETNGKLEFYLEFALFADNDGREYYS